MVNDGSMGPDGWTIYLATDDIAKVAEAAPANDGQVSLAPMAVGPLGQMAFLIDAGRRLRQRLAGRRARGLRTSGPSTAPRAGSSSTPATSRRTLDFYRNTFGATVEVISDADEFRYAMIMEGEDQAAGIMDASAFLPEGVPAHWSIYWSVDSTAVAVQQVVELGEARGPGAEDTPYGRLDHPAPTAPAPTFKLVERPRRRAPAGGRGGAPQPPPRSPADRSRRCLGRRSVAPPSTDHSAPVTYAGLVGREERHDVGDVLGLAPSGRSAASSPSRTAGRPPPTIGVAIPPGCTEFTRMPSGPRSWAADFDEPRTAHLLDT